MSRYIRPKRPGATVYFTVALAGRGSDLLVRHVDILREVARRTIRDKPFAVRASGDLAGSYALRVEPAGGGENRPRPCGVKTVQWTVFRFERPRTLARAGGSEEHG